LNVGPGLPPGLIAGNAHPEHPPFTALQDPVPRSEFGPGHPQGLMSSTPQPRKSRVFRVANDAPCERAIPAICESISPIVGSLARCQSSPCRRLYRPSTTSIPASTNSSFPRAILPTRSLSSSRSKATIRETLATESFGNPVTSDDNETFPGASAQRRLLVSGTQTTVEIRLRFSDSPCTTTTGRRNPGPDPVGAGKSAHQTSPWPTTIQYALKYDARPQPKTHPGHSPTRRTRDSWRQ